MYAQVLSLLPPYEGKSVLELGAGIGRFTGDLAQKADQLLALDFIDSVIKKVTLVDWIGNEECYLFKICFLDYFFS